MTFHTLIVVGNLGRDPEMRYTPGGQPVTSFSLATSRQYNNTSGEQVKETIWFRVSVFGKLAETCNQYLHKGSKVIVEGTLRADKNGSPRIWTRQDGTPTASFEMTATTVRFLTARSEGGISSEGIVESTVDTGDEDDIPF